MATKENGDPSIYENRAKDSIDYAHCRRAFPPLQPYQRCTCSRCLECQENEKWDRIFAKFRVSEDRWETQGLFQSTLRGW